MTRTNSVKYHILKFFIFFIFIVFSRLASAQSPGGKADFLIVEQPAALLIYNKYQQRLSFPEHEKLLPYQPMQILEEGIHLSDGYTPCMKIQANNTTYFLITDEEGNFVYEGETGYHMIFNNCLILGDTVEVLANQTIFISKTPAFQPAAQSQKYFLQQGERLQRLFSHRGFVYVQKIAPETDFGWSNLSDKTHNQSWRIVRRTGQQSKSIPPDVNRRIEASVQEMNYLLEQLFTHFNNQTGQQKTVPRWEMEISDTRIACSLNDPQYYDAFPESTRYLLNSLTSALLGTSFEVFYNPGRIEVRRRPGH